MKFSEIINGYLAQRAWDASTLPVNDVFLADEQRQCRSITRRFTTTGCNGTEQLIAMDSRYPRVRTMLGPPRGGVS